MVTALLRVFNIRQSPCPHVFALKNVLDLVISMTDISLARQKIANKDDENKAMTDAEALSLRLDGFKLETFPNCHFMLLNFAVGYWAVEPCRGVSKP